ncbi:unnamed protein product [Calypogeia fissa]
MVVAAAACLSSRWGTNRRLTSRSSRRSSSRSNRTGRRSDDEHPAFKRENSRLVPSPDRTEDRPTWICTLQQSGAERQTEKKREREGEGEGGDGQEIGNQEPIIGGIAEGADCVSLYYASRTAEVLHVLSVTRRVSGFGRTGGPVGRPHPAHGARRGGPVGGSDDITPRQARQGQTRSSSGRRGDYASYPSPSLTSERA